MIPVVGIPYISDFDLLDQCIKSLTSVERIHIIDNSYGGVEYQLDHRVRITRMHHNTGVAAAWNQIIKLYPNERWWAIFNSDVAFSPEDLERLEASMKVHEATLMGGMHAFGIRKSAIAKVGWFDENYVPAYCEDIDWHRRADLLGVEVNQIDDPKEHFGSATIRNSEAYRRENGRSYPANRRYYEQKWGGFVGKETYATPFDRGGSPRDWTLDITRLANLTWKE